MKYILTNNSIQFEGHTLYQLQEIDYWGFKGKYSGYVDNDYWISNPNIKLDIGKNAKIYGIKCHGHIYAGENSIIANDILRGSLSFGKNTVIRNSNIATQLDKVAIFNNECKVIDKDILAIGVYYPHLFEDGQFIVKMYNGINLILTDHYCRVNCKLMTYEEAWKYLHNDDIWHQLALKAYKDSQMVFTPNSKQWLLQECAAQLERLGIKK